MARGKPKFDWAALGVAAARVGDHETAWEHFANACFVGKPRAQDWYHFAITAERLGGLNEAASYLSKALRLKPDFPQAARRLSNLARRAPPCRPEDIDCFGIRAAMRSKDVDPQPLSEFMLTYLVQKGPLAEVIARAEDEGWHLVARSLIAARTAPVLRDENLLAALSLGLVKHPQVEFLLSALRGAVLELDDERFSDKDLWPVLLALARQCDANEFVWPESDIERTNLAKAAVGDALAAPSHSLGPSTLKNLLYRPLSAMMAGGLTPELCRNMKPRLLRDELVKRLDQAAREERAVLHIATIGEITDATSRAVAAQYESSPYPRWTALQRPAAQSLLKALQDIAPADSLALLEDKFSVLIAGCGTGRHAIQSAIGYGERANVLAIDLSARSLAYAKVQSEALQVPNLSFARADILGLEALESTFEIIETIGVLHHMADPFAGWRSLLDRLVPNGLIYVGLYSKVSRANLSALREEAAYPGVNCDDDAARNYRRDLMLRGDGEPGSELTASKDFYALSDFRDLVLHASEAQLTLPEIEKFLEQNRLEFLGFTIDPAIRAAFDEAFPQTTGNSDAETDSGTGNKVRSPGTLADWWAFEQAHPRTFDGMYRFWARKIA